MLSIYLLKIDISKFHVEYKENVIDAATCHSYLVSDYKQYYMRIQEYIFNVQTHLHMQIDLTQKLKLHRYTYFDK